MIAFFNWDLELNINFLHYFGDNMWRVIVKYFLLSWVKIMEETRRANLISTINAPWVGQKHIDIMTDAQQLVPWTRDYLRHQSSPGGGDERWLNALEPEETSESARFIALLVHVNKHFCECICYGVKLAKNCFRNGLHIILAQIGRWFTSNVPRNVQDFLFVEIPSSFVEDSKAIAILYGQFCLYKHLKWMTTNSVGLSWYGILAMAFTLLISFPFYMVRLAVMALLLPAWKWDFQEAALCVRRTCTEVTLFEPFPFFATRWKNPTERLANASNLKSSLLTSSKTIFQHMRLLTIAEVVMRLNSCFIWLEVVGNCWAWILNEWIGITSICFHRSQSIQELVQKCQ